MLPSSEPPLPRLAPLHRLPGPVLAPLLILTTMFSSRSEASKFNTYNLQLPVTSHLLLPPSSVFLPTIVSPELYITLSLQLSSSSNSARDLLCQLLAYPPVKLKQTPKV